MEFILLAIVTSMNGIIIKWKVEKGRYEDASLDFIVLLALATLFGGTMGGMIIATISSFIISIYLLMSPPDISKFIDKTDFDADSFLKEFKKRLPK